MLDFFTRFFRREEASKNLAKQRLRLVLMSDRISLAPETFDSMKGEMLSVVRRYLEIDEGSLDMHFENAERQFLLLANIPVLKVKSKDEVGLALPAMNGRGVAPFDLTAALVPDGEMLKPRRRRRGRGGRRKKKLDGSGSDDAISDF
jgi:cell division topological specificity factor